MKFDGHDENGSGPSVTQAFASPKDVRTKEPFAGKKEKSVAFHLQKLIQKGALNWSQQVHLLEGCCAIINSQGFSPPFQKNDPFRRI